MLLSDWIQIALTLGGFFYIFVRFKTEFDLHKQLLKELIAEVKDIRKDVSFIQGHLFGKK